MPYFPSCLHVEPIFNLTQAPGIEEVPLSETIQLVQPAEDHLAFLFSFHFYFTLFQSLWTLQLILRIVLYWQTYPPQVLSPPPTPIPPPTTSNQETEDDTTLSDHSDQSHSDDRSPRPCDPSILTSQLPDLPKTQIQSGTKMILSSNVSA